MKISIVCPVYNKEPYINQCIDSVLYQSFEDWELILVDDESPDNCPQICDEYAEKDSRIKVIHQKNKGHSESRNVGIRAAEGDYLMFLDADDYLYDLQVLSNMYKHTIENNLDICLSQIATLKADGTLVNSTFKYLDIPYSELSGKEVLCEMIRLNSYHASMCSRLFRRSLVVDNNLYFKRLICDDEEWTPQIFCYANKIGFLKKDGYVIRKLDNSVTGSKDTKTYIVKIKDKTDTTVMLMEKFKNFNLTRTQKNILYDKFYSFINMAVYSYFHDLDTANKKEIKNKLKSQLNEVKKYYSEISFKNKMKYLLSQVRLILK